MLHRGRGERGRLSLELGSHLVGHLDRFVQLLEQRRDGCVLTNARAGYVDQLSIGGLALREVGHRRFVPADDPPASAVLEFVPAHHWQLSHCRSSMGSTGTLYPPTWSTP